MAIERYTEGVRKMYDTIAPEYDGVYLDPVCLGEDKVLYSLIEQRMGRVFPDLARHIIAVGRKPRPRKNEIWLRKRNALSLLHSHSQSRSLTSSRKL